MSVRKNMDNRVWRAASQNLLTEDGAQHERKQMVQAVHPRLTCAPQDEERSTGYLLDDDLPLVQPMTHAIVERHLERGLLLSACPLTQKEVDLL